MEKLQTKTDETLFMEFLSECCNGKLTERINELRNTFSQNPTFVELFPLIFEKEVSQSEIMLLNIFSNIQIECKNEIILGYRNGMELPILLSLINFLRESVDSEELESISQINF